MTSDSIDWATGRVSFWGLERVDERAPLLEQSSELREDLAQVRYPNAVVLDVGFYPAFSDRGSFVVSVVQADDWDAPLFKQHGQTIDSLFDALRRAVNAAVSASSLRP
ncbi:MAG TPA: hypothetical protein VGI70_02040 [Polyangiales bacterium]|jgi:hypothetical protein